MFRKKIALALVFSFLLSIPAFADQNAPVPPTTVSPDYISFFEKFHFFIPW